MLKINYYRLFFLALFFNHSNALCSSFTQSDSDQNLPSLPLPSSSHNAYPPTNPSGLGSNMPNSNTNFDSLLSDLFAASLRNAQQEVTYAVAKVSTEKLSDLARTWHFNATLLSLLEANNNTLPPTLHNTSNTSNMSHIAAPMLHCESSESTTTFSANADTYHNDIPSLTSDELSSSNIISSVTPHTNPDKNHALPENNNKKKHPKKNYTCPTCNKNLASQQSLKRHLTTHNPNRKKLYECPFCDKRFSAKNPLECHIRTHTGEKPFKCDFCNKRFKAKNNKTRHQRIHTGEKRFKCDYCPKHFTTSFEKKQHHITHTGEKPFKCDFCNKRFKAKNNKTRHQRTHKGEKPFKCHICHKGLFNKERLNDHLNKHKGKKPYKCTQCTKAYATRNGLAAHLNTHNRPKPYICHYCDAAFALKREYKHHILYEEATDEGSKCHICKKAYTDKYCLRKHNKAIHSIN